MEQRRRSKLIRYGAIPPLGQSADPPPSEFEGIEVKLRSLSEKSELQRPVDRAHDDEVSGLLEDVRVVINNYKVCPQPSNPPLG